MLAQVFSVAVQLVRTLVSLVPLDYRLHPHLSLLFGGQSKM